MAEGGGGAAEAMPVQLEYVDTDGTVMEWDADRKAYFPKVRARNCSCNLSNALVALHHHHQTTSFALRLV